SSVSDQCASSATCHRLRVYMFLVFSPFSFHPPATSEIYTLSLHDALPIWRRASLPGFRVGKCFLEQEPHRSDALVASRKHFPTRSEEHTSELQSLRHLVCRLLLEKKKYMKTEKENIFKREEVWIRAVADDI